MGFIVQTLSSVEGTPLPYLFFSLPLSEQVLLEPTIEAFLAFLAIPEAIAIVIFVSYYFVLELVPFVLIILSLTLPSFYSPSNSYSM